VALFLRAPQNKNASGYSYPKTFIKTTLQDPTAVGLWDMPWPPTSWEVVVIQVSLA